jgi:hypothetical protein
MIEGMLAIARIPAATGTPALSKGSHNLNRKNASNSRSCVEKL